MPPFAGARGCLSTDHIAALPSMALPNLRNIVRSSCPAPRLPPLTPASLAAQFASFRSPLEDREYSRAAFFKFLQWVGVTSLMHLVAVKHYKRGATLVAG